MGGVGVFSVDLANGLFCLNPSLVFWSLAVLLRLLLRVSGLAGRRSRVRVWRGAEWGWFRWAVGTLRLPPLPYGTPQGHDPSASRRWAVGVCWAASMAALGGAGGTPKEFVSVCRRSRFGDALGESVVLRRWLGVRVYLLGWAGRCCSR